MAAINVIIMSAGLLPACMASPDYLPKLIIGHMTHVTTHIFKKLVRRELTTDDKRALPIT